MKVVLGYSGGLDTSVIVPWLTENYGAEVICMAGDVGQQGGLDGLEAKALATGASSFYGEDLRQPFVEEFVWPTLKIGAVYGRKYLLGTAMARPILGQRQVEIARLVGADAVSHGCTGKGNDQVRFDSGIMTLSAHGDPLRIIAPAREWGMTRDEEKLYAAKAGLELREVGSDQRVYSIDRNLWGQAIEGEDLEDTWVEPPEDAYSWTKPIADTPDEAVEVTIGFERGVPVSIDGKAVSGVKLIEVLNAMAGEHGVGRIDHIENRLVGIKSREVYETPAAIVLHTAIRALETATMSREQQRVKANLSAIYSDMVYDGRWFTELRTNIAAFMDSAHEFSTGDVRLRLHKGSCVVVGRRSPYSLYDFDLATYSTTDSFDHESATGFIDIYSLSARTQARIQTNRETR